MPTFSDPCVSNRQSDTRPEGGLNDMSVPENFLSDTGFAGAYRRLIETYRPDPMVLAEQFYRIMRRVEAEKGTGPTNRTTGRRTGERL